VKTKSSVKTSNGVTTKKKKTELEATIITSRYVTHRYDAIYVRTYAYMFVKKVSGELLNLLLSEYVPFNLRMVVYCMLLLAKFELAIGNCCTDKTGLAVLLDCFMLIILKLL